MAFASTRFYRDGDIKFIVSSNDKLLKSIRPIGRDVNRLIYPEEMVITSEVMDIDYLRTIFPLINTVVIAGAEIRIDN